MVAYLLTSLAFALQQIVAHLFVSGMIEWILLYMCMLYFINGGVFALQQA